MGFGSDASWVLGSFGIKEEIASGIGSDESTGESRLFQRQRDFEGGRCKDSAGGIFPAMIAATLVATFPAGHFTPAASPAASPAE
jgi:hypothetical protein